jgi:hypothetical protein
MGRLAYERLLLGEVGRLVSASAAVVVVVATAIQLAAILSIQPDKTSPMAALAEQETVAAIVMYFRFWPGAACPIQSKPPR